MLRPIGIGITLVGLGLGQNQPSVPPAVIVADPSSPYAPCEPSIAISRKDPRQMVAAAVLDYAAFTSDGGKSWSQQRVQSSHGVFGDPCLISDADGNFYFFHLATGRGPNRHLDRIVCQKSTDGGKTWSDGVGIGLNSPKQQDKQWAVAHPSRPILAATWTEFDKYGSKAPLDESRIRFSLSQDGGKSWNTPVTISDITGTCLDDDTTTEGAVPAFDSKGRLYVTWGLNGMIFFDRSDDLGKTWLPHDRPITRQYGGWDQEIEGLGRGNGMPILVCDTSNGPRQGTLYLVFADQREGEKDTDVFICKSADRGDTWTKPKRVSSSGDRNQFFPWLAIDQTDGRIYVVFYDQAGLTGDQTAVSVAWSEDGAETFQQRRVDAPFRLNPSGFFGDYNNISAHGGYVAPIWTRVKSDRTTEVVAVRLSLSELKALPK